MKRSEINKLLTETKRFLQNNNQPLPPFAFWSPKEWKNEVNQANEIFDCMLGWDVTDFGTNDFEHTGLLLFTLRNGNLNKTGYTKKYAQKYLVVKEKQVTPFHFHWRKAEDIINLCGGLLVVQLYNADENEQFANTDVCIHTDGQIRMIPAGGIVELQPGESITLLQKQYHSFWAKEQKGDLILMEVSDVNDDNSDNRFYLDQGRFSAVEEDEAPLHFLVSDYSKVKNNPNISLEK